MKINAFILLLLSSSFLVAQTTTPSTTSRAASSPVTARTSDSRYVLPAGAEIEVRINESLSSETSQQGDRFTGQISTDVTDRDTNRVLIPRGAQVEGRVLSATPSGRLTDSGELQLTINTIRNGASVMNVSVQPFIDKGESHTKSNTTKIGGGAALGAIIGAIAGGGKGAAIGAGVGGAAGAGAAAAGGKRPAEIKPEAVLKFVTASELTVNSQMSAPATARTSSTGGTYPATPSTSTSPSNSSDANFPTPSSSTSSSTGSSSSSDEAPVLQKRGGGTVVGSTTASNTTTAGTSSGSTSANGTYGTSTPPASTSSAPSSSTYPSSTTSSTTQSTYPSIPPASNTAPSPADGRSFSARDRRVANACVRDHAASLPESALRKAPTARAFQKGDMIPADVQRQLRALPLQCDRELPTLSNDLERVIYGGQVMLIDTSSRVLDVFELIQ